MYRVVVIGSGNVAEAFALALASVPQGEYRLVQVYARNAARRGEIERLAGIAGAEAATESEAVGLRVPVQELAPADIYIIAVSDDAVGTVSTDLDFGGAVVAHTAGSVDMDELDGRIVNRGVIYPLQTFTAGYEIDFDKVPLFVEGANCDVGQKLLGLARALSDNVALADSRQRLALHIAAVFASNFTNSMYAIGQRLLADNGLEPHLLDPLILQTAAKAVGSPSATVVQTGPARRGDKTTMEKHLEMLRNSPELHEIYKLLSSNIWETSKKM